MNSRRQPTYAPYLVIVLTITLLLLVVVGQGQSASPEASTVDIEGPIVSFSSPSGFYDQTISVTMRTNVRDAKIYFTVDGSLPTPQDGTLYSVPLSLSPRPPQVVSLRAVAVTAAGQSGAPASATYIMGLHTAVPVISLTIDPDDLWDSTNGIFVNPLKTGPQWERPAEITFLEPGGSRGFTTPVGVRVHGGRSRLDEKKSLRLYFRDSYGQAVVEYPLFPDSAKQTFKRLVLHNGGQDYPAISVNATLLRNQLTGVLAKEAGGFAVETRPVLVYLNGDLWGIYDLRERIDDRYLAETMGMADPDLLVGFENALEASYGDLQNWENLQQFVRDHDLREADNYAYVQTQVNFDNFIDYNLFQIITANADWPHSNQLKFRDRAGGQWHWMFWDSDYAFGLMPDSYIEKNMFERVLEQEDEDQQEAAMMLDKLLQNPDFRNRFLVRLADLLNTVFVAEKAEAQVDTLASELEKDIQFEIIRWPGTGDWQAGVEYMREFARRRPDIVREQALDQFDLLGTAMLTIGMPQSGQGSLRVNQNQALAPADLPWSGTYFQGTTLRLEAIAAPGYVFTGWDGSVELPAEASVQIELAGDAALSPRFEKVIAAVPRAGDVQIIDYGFSGSAVPVAGLEGAWVTLEVRKSGGLDIRGWRVTDNDTLNARDEGSLILSDDPLFAHVPAGTKLLLLADPSLSNQRLLGDNETGAVGWILASPDNKRLDISTDPWFRLGQADNLALLAPGPTAEFDDDIAIDFVQVGQGEPRQSSADFGLPER